MIDALLNYLFAENFSLFRVSKADMRDKAVVKFSFDLGMPPLILLGPFEDETREISCIAHEAGHIIIYQKMEREQARTYLCTMFALSGIGLSQISTGGQEIILTVEAGASASGLAILKKIGIGTVHLMTAATLMAKWYASYEKLCQSNIVKRVRQLI